MNIGADFVFAEEADFTGYDVLLVPPLYVASDALLEKIAAFAKAGGHVLLTLKSGFTNEWDTVRWTRAPGPLREAAGVSYQEFSSLKAPLALKGDPFGVGPDKQGLDVGGHAAAGDGEVARHLRPPVLRPVPGAHAQRVRQGQRDLPGERAHRRPRRRRSSADVLKQAGIPPRGCPERCAPGTPRRATARRCTSS